MNSLQRILAIFLKELRQLARDKPTFGMVVMVPLIQLLLFGYAINTDVRHLPVAVVDHAANSGSRAMVAAVQASQVANVVRYEHSIPEAEEIMRRGDIRAILIIPRDFEQRMARKEIAAQWLVDGSDPMISSAIKHLANMPASAMPGFYSQPEPPLFEITLYYNPEQRAVVNIVPGLVGVILTMTMIMFTSAALVRERERGNLELLITTPVKPVELMIGKIVPYIFIGLLQVGIILTLGYLIFSVPIDGSIVQILLATLLFIAASLTMGLIISTLATTQLQSMQMTVFILLPSILLSGFMFPFEGMPKAAQWLAELLPATHYMRLMRGIVLRGASISHMWMDVIALAVFTLLGIWVAAMRFKKTLD
ncbi:ABC transporter [Endozoicomonas montiporae]|uniref:Transport permease protein n=2 Tax=Endozoicomonas montiporae TaxID=1027273 RepID=A0A081N2R4_9GAMM|nr:ABC transporter permease [Endozoicomonas montiporae]AMO58002.1 multidrug ABC transporter permease [Endozoicomonas montiporae CL-33]KEQ12737.1 ABC transporter [Endozoicomonas montiporae]